MNVTTCALCRAVEHIERRLTRLDPSIVPDRPEFSVVTRCRDDGACRARVEAAGRIWPLATPTLRPSGSTARPAVSSEPLSVGARMARLLDRDPVEVSP